MQLDATPRRVTLPPLGSPTLSLALHFRFDFVPESHTFLDPFLADVITIRRAPSNAM